MRLFKKFRVLESTLSKENRIVKGRFYPCKSHFFSLSLRLFICFKCKHIILSKHILEMYITYLLMCLYIVYMQQMSVPSHFFLTIKCSFYSINIYSLTKNKETIYVCFRSITKKECSPEDSLLLISLTIAYDSTKCTYLPRQCPSAVFRIW